MSIGADRRTVAPTAVHDPWSHSHVTLAQRCCDLLVLSALTVGCGWLPPDHPAARPAPPDPDAAVFHGWKVTGQVLGPRALISEADAAEFRDRTVEVNAIGYSAPWSGACGEARREKQPRALTEVAAAHELDRAANLGLVEPIVEYQLLCIANRTPPLILYVAGPHAVTCWSGVCYLLGR